MGLAQCAVISHSCTGVEEHLAGQFSSRLARTGRYRQRGVTCPALTVGINPTSRRPILR